MYLTILIIGATVLVSILCFNNTALFDKLKFNAYDVKHGNQLSRFFTYGFVHAGWMHLFVNMFVLYSFGDIVETYFRFYFQGKYILYYLLLYIGGLLLSIIPAFGKHKNDVFYNAVGASGAISAILFSSILLHPTGKIYFFFIPVGIPAPVFGVLYLAYEYYMSRRAKDNIGHDAHFWGAVFGIIFTIAIRPAFITEFLQKIGLQL
jgi:membrane associated rhomboid family serine protease